MTTTVLLRSRVRGNPQARFWRAVGVATLSLTLIIMLKALGDTPWLEKSNLLYSVTTELRGLPD